MRKVEMCVVAYSDNESGESDVITSMRKTHCTHDEQRELKVFINYIPNIRTIHGEQKHCKERNNAEAFALWKREIRNACEVKVCVKTPTDKIYLQHVLDKTSKYYGIHAKFNLGSALIEGNFLKQ